MELKSPAFHNRYGENEKWCIFVLFSDLMTTSTCTINEKFKWNIFPAPFLR
jgi:hypothetical protein